MLDAARTDRDGRIADAATIDQAVEATRDGWARIPWSAVGDDGELQLAQSTVTVRCLHRADGSVPDSDTEDGLVAFVARSY
jgi:prolyl-tRNA synthetase